MPDEKVFQRVILEKIKVAVGTRIPNSMLMEMNIRTCMDMTADQLMIQLQTYVAGRTTTNKTEDKKTTKVINIPRTPWEFFKQVYAPAWFTKKYPVQYDTIPIETVVQKTVTTTNICPHMDLPAGDKSHFEFITTKGNHYAHY
jgi:hypothetical protein